MKIKRSQVSKGKCIFCKGLFQASEGPSQIREGAFKVREGLLKNKVGKHRPVIGGDVKKVRTVHLGNETADNSKHISNMCSVLIFQKLPPSAKLLFRVQRPGSAGRSAAAANDDSWELSGGGRRYSRQKQTDHQCLTLHP